LRLPRFSGRFVSLQSTSWSWRPACRLRRLSVSGIPGPNALRSDDFVLSTAHLEVDLCRPHPVGSSRQGGRNGGRFARDRCRDAAFQCGRAVKRPVRHRRSEMRVLGLALAEVLAITASIAAHANGPGLNMRPANAWSAPSIVLVWDGGGSGGRSGVVGADPAGQVRQWNGGWVQQHWRPNGHPFGWGPYG
jgi:hypothetical protein